LEKDSVSFEQHWTAGEAIDFIRRSNLSTDFDAAIIVDHKLKPLGAILLSTLLKSPIAIELHTHILKIFIMLCAVLAIFSLVIGFSISSLFTSIWTAAALLTFIFKDTVLGLLASLQLTFQNIIRVGDWVTLQQYNANDDIQKIVTISVVVIRNFDNTYTTVLT